MKTLTVLLLLAAASATFAIQASPDEVYSKLVHNVGSWWDPAHTISNDAANLSIEEKPMGCFCEKLPAAERCATWR